MVKGNQILKKLDVLVLVRKCNNKNKNLKERKEPNKIEATKKKKKLGTFLESSVFFFVITQ